MKPHNVWYVYTCLTQLSLLVVYHVFGGRGGTVVKVLCYKSVGRYFDPKWCFWNFFTFTLYAGRRQKQDLAPTQPPPYLLTTTRLCLYNYLVRIHVQPEDGQY